MTNSSGPVWPTMSEYDEALKAWNLAAATWLGLDPASVFRFNANGRESSEFGMRIKVGVEARWSAVAQLTPRLGHLHAPGVSSDGETTTFTGSVSLDGPDSEAFWTAVGPKPQMFTRGQELMLKGLAAEAAEREARGE